MTEKQKRMVRQSQEKYPGDINLDKQLAYIDGYRSAESDQFGVGLIFGFLISAVIAVIMIVVAVGDEKTRQDQPRADVYLNSKEWKIDTIRTITNDKDSVTTYKFVRVNEKDDKRQKL